jgi:hypothetical protein
MRSGMPRFLCRRIGFSMGRIAAGAAAESFHGRLRCQRRAVAEWVPRARELGRARFVVGVDLFNVRKFAENPAQWITVYEYRCSNCETAYIAPAVGAELTCGGRFFERLLRPGNWPLVYKLSYLHPLRRAAGFSSHRRYSSARRTHDRSRSL